MLRHPPGITLTEPPFPDPTLFRSPVFEGPDLAIIAPTIDDARKISEAYTSVLDKAFQKKFNAKLLALTPYPSQMIFCKPEIKSVKDLAGKKFRVRSEEHTSELQSLMRISYAVFCLKKNKKKK